MDITPLAQAVQSAKAGDAFDAGLDAPQWHALLPYLSRQSLRAGEALMRQGDSVRCACWLEQGNLQIFVSGGAPGATRIGVLRPGALVGEAALLADVPRAANVEAMTPAVVWCLSATQLDRLCADHPALGLRLLRATAAVMARRVHAHLHGGAPLV
ncbi:MAG TPA: cyclic nucleotide-binding domain-containing protein [Rubrivivax sp.]|mgnify:CR=1 FL=1|nr:cyclic nucleotide-binding domain-containing protein [Rubrivivax sp.]HPO17621.1 cyclic nucleotide-binding domain-containing protein [Rubrivivax sp.]